MQDYTKNHTTVINGFSVSEMLGLAQEAKHFNDSSEANKHFNTENMNALHKMTLPTSMEEFEKLVSTMMDVYNHGDLLEKQSAMIVLGNAFQWLRAAQTGHFEPFQQNIMHEKGINQRQLETIANKVAVKGINVESAAGIHDYLCHFAADSNSWTNHINDTLKKDRHLEKIIYKEFDITSEEAKQVEKGLYPKKTSNDSSLSISCYLSFLSTMHSIGKNFLKKQQKNVSADSNITQPQATQLKKDEDNMQHSNERAQFSTMTHTASNQTANSQNGLYSGGGQHQNNTPATYQTQGWAAAAQRNQVQQKQSEKSVLERTPDFSINVH